MKIIDNLIVYDRRGSVPINSDCISLKGAEYYFSQRILPFDKPITGKPPWELKSIAKRRLAEETKKYSYSKSWTEGDIYHFILEVGKYRPTRYGKRYMIISSPTPPSSFAHCAWPMACYPEQDTRH